MISPVSVVSFGDDIATKTLMQREGKFSHKPTQKVAMTTETPEKEMSATAKTMIGVGVVALATAGYLGYAVKKGSLEKIANPTGISEKLKNIGFSVGEKVKDGYEAVVGLFSRTKKADPK